MAEQIPYAVAASLIDRLGSAALREFGRIYGVMDELERLKNTVESIRAVLLDAEDKQEEQNHAVQNWVRRLKDVLLPADDLLDEFVIQNMIHKRDEPHQNKLTKVFHSFSPNNISFRRDMAHEIEKIQKKINDVVKDMSGLNLNPNVVVVQKTNIERRETSSYVLESDIIGREDDKKKIISLLRQPNEAQNVSLVAIVGIGGLGKTTLAQLVYSDVQVQNLFEKSMWVCVSHNFNVKTIVKNMLESLTKKKADDTLSLDTLQNMLRDNLTGKRYLLVLDDIWNDSFEKWDKLRTYLMCGAQGSKIVVTTRSTIVAQTMGVSVPYVLNGLIPKESWSLLKKIAFGNDSIEVDPNIESIGKKIAEKCKGVPLAIRSLGSILHSKSEQKEWNDVLRGDFWKLCEDKESILPVLKLSYNNLSPQQRQCFAYCSLFPKDWKFWKDELIQMWMAHGYLDSSVEGKCMEDVGNQFVNIFLMKSFFQEAKLNEDGDVISFKMHDLMHDLAKQVAGDDCCYLDDNTKGFRGRPVHVSVHFSGEFDAFDLLKSLNASRLRTLIVFSSDHSYFMDGEQESLISTFKYLRVFKLPDFGYIELCGSIEKWNHLRFLKLSFGCKQKKFLKSIGNLICLQTLEMRFMNEKVILSTKFVSKLINLRRLCIRLWTFKEKTSVRFGKLCIKQHRGVNFSEWLSPLTNINQIALAHCQGLKYLPPLERLPFLKSLDISSLDDLEYIYYKEFILHEPFFPSLKRLEISGCTKLVGWKRIGDDINDINTSSQHLLLPQFPCLSFWKICECLMLTHMPTFPNIKSLELIRCNGKILEATLNITASQYLIGFPPLSMLKFLKIQDVDLSLFSRKKTTNLDLKTFPQHWLQNLTSLEKLEFDYLSSEHFQVIEIWFKDDINYLPSLQKITFHFCDGLKTLPDWIFNISSLQNIKISWCSNLESLPEGMSRLTNLHTLEIIECPLLIEECQKETSVTRTRIAHIPNIITKGTILKRNVMRTS